uniref:Uncharacterized protein n=1 Tax=Romanomermis culicivorax TaxID=13658 RepID=A0A915I466_ROMCU
MFLRKYSMNFPNAIIFNTSNYSSSLVEDGYFCRKVCQLPDVQCLANHTVSISYQFAALPSTTILPIPVEVIGVRAESLDGSPFYVRYVVDRRNADRFYVIQNEKNVLKPHNNLTQIRKPLAS